MMPTVIPNTNVVDVANCRILIGRDVIIDSGNIWQVRPAQPLMRDWAVLSGGVKTWVLPGLIDAHVHLLEMHEGPDAGRLPEEPLQRALQRGMDNLKVALSAGITTLRDVGAYQA